MQMRRLAITVAAVALIGTTSCMPEGGGGGATIAAPVASAKVAGKTVQLETPTGNLLSGKRHLVVTFADAKGNPVEDVKGKTIAFVGPAEEARPVEQADLEWFAKGAYTAVINVPPPGIWQAVVTFEDASGTHQAKMTVNVIEE